MLAIGDSLASKRFTNVILFREHVTKVPLQHDQRRSAAPFIVFELLIFPFPNYFRTASLDS